METSLAVLVTKIKSIHKKKTKLGLESHEHNNCESLTITFVIDNKFESLQIQ